MFVCAQSTWRFILFDLLLCPLQALGHQVAAVASKAAEHLEAPAVDPDQQRQIEEQQRRQEAVFQKDRVGFLMMIHEGFHDFSSVSAFFQKILSDEGYCVSRGMPTSKKGNMKQL